MAKIYTKEGPIRGAAFELDKDIVSIGRDPENDIYLPHQTVSRFHARLVREGDAWFISDLDSRNGTVLNGRTVKREELAAMDELHIGDLVLVFADEEETSGVDILAAESDGSEPAITKTMSVHSLPLLSRKGGPSETEMVERNRKLVLLLELSQAAGKLRNLPALFDQLTESLQETLSPDRVVPILKESGERLVPYLRTKSRIDKALSKVGVSTTIVRHCLDREEAVLSQSTSSDKRFSASPSVARHKIATAMCAPLKIGDALLGVIYADRIDDSENFSGGDLEYLSAVSLQVAVAVENIRSYERIAAQARSLEKEIKGQYNIIGSSPAIQKVFAFITKAGPTDACVLVTGESGTGKELVARAVHFNSNRKDGPFEAVNCAAMNPSLIESELFGHIKGAFTGAVNDHPGRFELATEGSIFLDEIGDLPLECQTKLLRVLEEGRIRRIGDVKDRRIDVRVIAATNRDLDELKAQGKFREDLFYRLDVLRTDLPPLRDRGEDIEALARYFLAGFSKKCGRSIEDFEQEVISVFNSYTWPGNVRELRNVVERMVIMSESEVLGTDVLPFDLNAGEQEKAALKNVVVCSLAEMEERQIIGVLNATKGNKKRAAAILGIDRSTLYAKLKAYGLDK